MLILTTVGFIRTVLTVALVADGNHERMMGMNDNFERGKKQVIDNALDVLERLTGLSDSSLDAIREAIEEEDKVLVAVPKDCVECCTPSEAGCACCTVWQVNEKGGRE